MNRNRLFLNSPVQKAAEIPPSLRYGATFPGSRTRRSSKSEGGFRRSRRVSLPQPAKRHMVSLSPGPCIEGLATPEGSCKQFSSRYPLTLDQRHLEGGVCLT